jgi:hypothetical protein
MAKGTYALFELQYNIYAPRKFLKTDKKFVLGICPTPDARNAIESIYLVKPYPGSLFLRG